MREDLRAWNALTSDHWPGLLFKPGEWLEDSHALKFDSVYTFRKNMGGILARHREPSSCLLIPLPDQPNPLIRRPRRRERFRNISNRTADDQLVPRSHEGSMQSCNVEVMTWNEKAADCAKAWRRRSAIQNYSVKSNWMVIEEVMETVDLSIGAFLKPHGGRRQRISTNSFWFRQINGPGKRKWSRN